jgi:hypothetical protein
VESSASIKNGLQSASPAQAPLSPRQADALKRANGPLEDLIKNLETAQQKLNDVPHQEAGRAPLASIKERVTQSYYDGVSKSLADAVKQYRDMIAQNNQEAAKRDAKFQELHSEASRYHASLMMRINLLTKLSEIAAQDIAEGMKKRGAQHERNRNRLQDRLVHLSNEVKMLESKFEEKLKLNVYDYERLSAVVECYDRLVETESEYKRVVISPMSGSPKASEYKDQKHKKDDARYEAPKGYAHNQPDVKVIKKYKRDLKILQIIALLKSAIENNLEFWNNKIAWNWWSLKIGNLGVPTGIAQLYEKMSTKDDEAKKDEKGITPEEELKSYQKIITDRLNQAFSTRRGPTNNFYNLIKNIKLDNLDKDDDKTVDELQQKLQQDMKLSVKLPAVEHKKVEVSAIPVAKPAKQEKAKMTPQDKLPKPYFSEALFGKLSVAFQKHFQKEFNDEKEDSIAEWIALLQKADTHHFKQLYLALDNFVYATADRDFLEDVLQKELVTDTQIPLIKILRLTGEIYWIANYMDMAELFEKRLAQPQEELAKLLKETPARDQEYDLYAFEIKTVLQDPLLQKDAAQMRRNLQAQIQEEIDELEDEIKSANQFLQSLDHLDALDETLNQVVQRALEKQLAKANSPRASLAAGAKAEAKSKAPAANVKREKEINVQSLRPKPNDEPLLKRAKALLPLYIEYKKDPLYFEKIFDFKSATLEVGALSKVPGNDWKQVEDELKKTEGQWRKDSLPNKLSRIFDDLLSEKNIDRLSQNIETQIEQIELRKQKLEERKNSLNDLKATPTPRRGGAPTYRPRRPAAPFRPEPSPSATPSGSRPDEKKSGLKMRGV